MKAHSARVSGKNFRTFCGKPLFRWILDTLLSLEEISTVVINTDAEDILASHGLVSTDRILVRKRREEICGDFVSMNLVLADDIANVPADLYLMTHTTNPLIRAESIRNAIQSYQAAAKAGTGDSLFAVNKFQTRFYRADASPINHDPNNLIRTQDLEPWFEENSNLYLFSKESFAATNARIGKKPVLFEQSRLESVDIDDQTGWYMAEAIAEYLQARPNLKLES